MASLHSARRARKLRRRGSAASPAWPTGSPKSFGSAPTPTRSPSRRPVSQSPLGRNAFLFQRPHLTDGSDYEDYRPRTLSESTQSRPRGRSTSPTRAMFDQRPPLTAYASLPPTPIHPSRPFSPPTPVSPIPHELEARSEIRETPFSLWDYLREELLATDFDSHQELKWERVSNFLSMPLAMEKVCV
jgi:hypothetical protein